MRLAANPYLLTVMMQLPTIPSNRAQLFAGFLQVLFKRERTARDERHDAARVPDEAVWDGALVELAETLQHKQASSESDGTQTTLSRANWPARLTDEILDFSIDASVLQKSRDDIRFSHQLLQEYLASRLFLDASRAAARSATEFWPTATWWERTGWEVVAEIAAEACDADIDAQNKLIGWLAKANPEVASAVWKQIGRPELPKKVTVSIAEQWRDRMTDADREPNPLARAAIGRALGRFRLDLRQGIGLQTDGTPDIDWVTIPAKPFIYQGKKHPALPAFRIARYPVTNAQFNAFIDAGEYDDDRWWDGMSKRIPAPDKPEWDEPNSPRETVTWYEAIAFCRWLSQRLDQPVTLPTEEQWERAASGTIGSTFPWGNDYQSGHANIDEQAQNDGPYDLGQTSAVGIYTEGASPEGALDMSGNVWEWCLNVYGNPRKVQTLGAEARVLRGGSWRYNPEYACAAARGGLDPDYSLNNFGFRVCGVVPIE